MRRPRDDCLEAVNASECPATLADAEALRTCDLVSPGELCYGQWECSTDGNLDNWNDYRDSRANSADSDNTATDLPKQRLRPPPGLQGHAA